jgi:uncharacterized protein
MEERKMSLLDTWRDKAYDASARPEALKAFWDEYFPKEKSVYEILLKDPDKEIKGTVSELADRFGFDIMTMTGFLDGINDSLVEPNPIETMDENTVVSLSFDKKKLYMNMVDAEADWLYNLPEWNAIFSEAERHEMFLTQKKSHTVVKPKKIYPNDPCPCGSGKKYKNCHGKKGTPKLS